MLHVHADVWLGLGAHAHAPAGLHAENAADVVIVQHLRPCGVRQNHHFAYQRVNRRTALAAGDAHLALFVEFNAVVVFFRRGGVFVAVAAFLQCVS